MTDPVRLALIGSGIAASMAPAFHEAAGALAGLRVTYDLIERAHAHPNEIRAIVDRCRDDGYAGLNVTYPYKEAAFACAAVDDPTVRQIGAVNTIVLRASGIAAGSNTDYSGLLRRWRARWPERRPGVVALLGAGGVGRSTAFALAELGASELRLFDLEAEKCRRLADALARSFSSLRVVSAPTTASVLERADGVVNATPVGMYFSPGSPCDLGTIGEQSWLLDVVYSPIHTPLVARATAAGMDVMSGFELFLGQGFDAFEQFTGRSLAPDAARELEDEMWRQVRNRAVDDSASGS